jgi:cell division protein FtsZ
MVVSLTLPIHNQTEFTARLAVIGVGGGGCNAVNTMVSLGLEGVEFLAANTDAQSLANSRAARRLQLGMHLTGGLGAGARPEIGRAAAEEATEEIVDALAGVHMLFVTAGMGGGTGTGAAPVIARLARERGALTVGVVTRPFDFEGPKRRRLAAEGIEALQQSVDTLIVVPNQNLFRVATPGTTLTDAFRQADDVLHLGVRGITDLIVRPGVVNLDFADIRTIMTRPGKAIMGTGEAEGADRALQAAEAAISNPLLEDTSIKGASGVLISITGGQDLTLFDVEEAANRVRREMGDEADAEVIFGTAIDGECGGRLRVSVVATGIDPPTAARGQARPEATPPGEAGPPPPGRGTADAHPGDNGPVVVLPSAPVGPPGLPMPVPRRPARPASPGGNPDAPLDVPTFLRRQRNGPGG